MEWWDRFTFSRDKESQKLDVLRKGGSCLKRNKATVQVETVYQLLDALYGEYPDGAASMPESIGEAVINVLCELDQEKKGEGYGAASKRLQSDSEKHLD